MKDKELSGLKKEINKLKKKYEKALALSSSYEERNQLMQKIAQLEAIKKSPSGMKSFASTFGRGLKITGKNLWGAIRRGSRNLERNSPEFRELSKVKQKPSTPFSPIVRKAYFPQSSPADIDAMNYQAEPIRKVKPLMTKKQIKKLKKRGFRITDKSQNPLTWELP